MPAEQKETCKLHIHTGDEAAEVIVINGQFQRIDAKVGQSVTFELPKGLYTIKVVVASRAEEKSIALREETTLPFQPVIFSSPAPLENTTKTTGTHVIKAREHSINVDINAGNGSQIYVFARLLQDNEAITESVPPSENPAGGLVLTNTYGQVLADFGNQATATYESGPASWSACNVQLDPGVYCLRLETKKGNIFNQSIVASAGWQTQIFLLQRDYDIVSQDDEYIIDLFNASIFMSEIGKGFVPSKADFSEDPDFRLTEIARQALIKNRPAVQTGIIDRMLNDKFKNPMLGIYGCHLLLLNDTVHTDRLSRIVGKLRDLLGNTHPEVEAIALKANLPTDHIFDMPPMMRQSWGYVLEASITKPGLVPLDSFTAKIAGHLWSSGQWLLWGKLDTINTEDYLTQMIRKMVSPKIQQPRNKHYARRSKNLEVAKPLGSKKSIRAKTYELKLNDEKMKFIVQASGLPRSAIDAVLQSFNIKNIG